MSNDLVGGAVPSCSAFAEVAGDLGGAGCAGGAGGEGGEVSFMTGRSPSIGGVLNASMP